MATIELKAKDVPGLGGIAQHMYVTFTLDNGETG